MSGIIITYRTKGYSDFTLCYDDALNNICITKVDTGEIKELSPKELYDKTPVILDTHTNTNVYNFDYWFKNENNQ